MLARARTHAFWTRPDGGCPACVEEILLRTLLKVGAPAFADAVQAAWPLDSQWHGTMTSVVAAGNGFAGAGLYRGLAPDADVVLVQVRDARGRVTSESIARGLEWVAANADELGIRVVSLSIAGDPPATQRPGPVDLAAERLVERGIVVVAAAGNDGQRRLVPPATAPSVLTIGGLDDHNTLGAADADLWHGNFGPSTLGTPKPELVAPSIWVVAPVLPGSAVSREAGELFRRRVAGATDGDGLVTPRLPACGRDQFRGADRRERGGVPAGGERRARTG